MGYAVKFESQGPAGMVYYQEHDFTLPFYWERTTVGFDTSAKFRKVGCVL